MPGFATSLAPVVEHVAQMLADASPYDVSNPSILTKEKHKAAARLRVSGSSAKSMGDVASFSAGTTGLNFQKKRRQRPAVEYEPFLPSPVCRGCGLVLEPESNRKRSRAAYCPQCLARRRSEIGVSPPSASAVRRQRFRDETGTRPTHTPQATSRRSKANIAQRVGELAWEAKHTDEEHDPEWFRQEVLPALGTLTLT
jgi:hypothetical protein